MKNLFGLSLIILLASSCSTSRVGQTDNVTAKIEADNSCTKNEDCAVIKADCCGCTQGGTQQTINKTVAKEALAALDAQCGDTVCIQQISTDPSCGKQASCVGGACVLQ